MKKELILTFGALSLLLWCCSSEDVGINGPAAGNPVPSGVPMEIVGAELGSLQPMSRAATSTPITSGQIGVFLDNAGGGTDYDPKNNVCYTASKEIPTKWSSTDALFFSESIAEVCAYYPYNSDSKFNDSKAIPLTTQAYDANKDLCYATNKRMNASLETPTTEAQPGNKISFSMVRAYALLELQFKRGKIKDDCTISKIEIKASGLNASNTINITKSSDNYGLAKPCTDNKFELIKEIIVGLNTETSSPVIQQILLVPTTASISELGVTLTLASPGSPTMSAKVSLNQTITSGKKYIIRLTVNGTDLEPASVSTEDWVGSTIRNGSSPYIPLPG